MKEAVSQAVDVGPSARDVGSTNLANRQNGLIKLNIDYLSNKVESISFENGNNRKIYESDDFEKYSVASKPTPLPDVIEVEESEFAHLPQSNQPILVCFFT